MAMLDIQSLFQDIIESPRQRQRAMEAQGLAEAQAVTSNLSGGARLAAPLLAQLAMSAGKRDEMLQRSLGGLFGVDTRTPSQQLQGALRGADISTEEGREALLQRVNEVSPTHGARLQQEFNRMRAAQEAVQNNVAANLELIETSSLSDSQKSSLKRVIAANPETTADKLVTIIKNMGGMPKEETFTTRTAQIKGEEGYQVVKVNNKGEIFKDVEDEDGNIRTVRLPSSAVSFVTRQQVEQPEPVPDPRQSIPTSRPESPAETGLFDYVGDAVGATSWAVNLYNESPFADVFGVNRPVAEARARFNVFENDIMNMYKRSSRPSNWQEQRLLRLLPKPGPMESRGSAIAKLYALQKNIQDQYDYEIQQFELSVGDRDRAREHADNARDLERLLNQFNTPRLDNVPEVVFSREEAQNLPPNTQYYLDGQLFTTGPLRVTTEEEVRNLPPGTTFIFGNETTPRVRR